MADVAVVVVVVTACVEVVDVMVQQSEFHWHSKLQREQQQQQMCSTVVDGVVLIENAIVVADNIDCADAVGAAAGHAKNESSHEDGAEEHLLREQNQQAG